MSNLILLDLSAELICFDAQEGGHLELQKNQRIQWLIPTVLCPIAKLIGYKATYPEYESKLAGAPDLKFSLA